MRIELSEKEFRRLLDVVYIGNWILNSTRDENDRIAEFDAIESKIFSHCGDAGMESLIERTGGDILPSVAFEQGGIHEAIAAYEDAVFFEILAEELARRDMSAQAADEDDIDELTERIDAYIDEFEQNGTDNIILAK